MIEIIKKVGIVILKVLTLMMLLLFIVSVSALDSDTYIPFITALISMLWLFVAGLIGSREFDPDNLGSIDR